MVISGSCRSNDSFTGRLRRRYRCYGSGACNRGKGRGCTEQGRRDQGRRGQDRGGSSPAGADVAGMTVAFVPKLTGNAFFESANNGAQEYSKGWGFTVDYQGSANAAVADQVNVINNAVASGVDALCISSVDATGLDSALTEARDAGVTVVTWDSDVSDTARTLMVSQGTPELLGKMLVDMGADSLTNRGKDTKRIPSNTAGIIHRQQLPTRTPGR